MSDTIKKGTGYMVDILLLAAVAAFLVSAGVLLVGGRAEVWLLALLVSGLASVVLSVIHMVMEWLLGWEW